MDNTYKCGNGAMPTTAAFVPITTGTAIKTLLQIATPSTRDLRIAAWGVTLDGAPSAIKFELVQTDVAATVTAHVAAGVQPFSDPNAPASLVTLGTAATGFTATAEGTITATRQFDETLMSTNIYVYEWPLGHEPRVPVSKFLRVRCTAAVAVNAWVWVRWKEA